MQQGVQTEATCYNQQCWELLHGQQCTGLIFAMFTSPIIHLVSRPKFCISIVLSFSFDDCITDKKLKTKFMHNFGGKQGVLWEMFNYDTTVQGEIEDAVYAKYV